MPLSEPGQHGSRIGVLVNRTDHSREPLVNDVPQRFTKPLHPRVPA